MRPAHWEFLTIMRYTAGMLTRPAGHEAEAEAEARHAREQLSVYEHEH